MPPEVLPPSPDTDSPDRRPIASRRRPLWQAVANWMARRRFSPNAISVASIFAGLLASLALAATSHVDAHLPIRLLFLLAVLGIQLRLICNMLDGMVALGRGVASSVGELYNEIPDRVSDAAIFIGAGYALGASPVLGYLAAITAILTAYIRAIGKAQGAGNDFAGPMAKQHRMFTLTLAALAMTFLPANLLARLTVAHQYNLIALALLVITLGSLLTCLRRLTRIARKLRAPQLPPP